MPKNAIRNFIDFFYPPFQKLMPLQTFRYAACGAANTVLDIGLFAINYNFILHKQVLNLGFMAFEPYTAAFIMSFCISFPVGFFLMRHIVFTQSTLHGRVQLFRYFLLVTACIFLNYVFIKLFVEKFHFYPTVAKMATTVIVIAFSYLTQKHFTFKTATTKP